MWLQTIRDGDASGGALADVEDREQLGVDRAIVCASCGAVVTADKHRVVRGGAHRHTQMNPHGYFYTLLCFAEARGIRQVGAPSAEWSWFDGYAWIIGDCAACGVHLGWRFVPVAPEAGEAFYGLIEERLVESEGETR